MFDLLEFILFMYIVYCFINWSINALKEADGDKICD